MIFRQSLFASRQFYFPKQHFNSSIHFDYFHSHHRATCNKCHQMFSNKKYIDSHSITNKNIDIFQQNHQQTHVLLSLEDIQKILKEVKHLMLVICNSISRDIAKKMKMQSKEEKQETQNHFKGEIDKIQRQKTNFILKKFQTNRQDYQNSLKKYQSDNQICKNRKEISQMKEKASKGQNPDISIPKDCENKFSKNDLKYLYREISLLIATKFWRKLLENKRLDPNFDPKNNAHFIKAIREAGIYEIKVKFLIENGFLPSWGCPNEMFFKLLESQKNSEAAFKNEIVLIEKGYEKIIEKISYESESMKEEDIAEIMLKSEHFTSNT